MFFCIIKKYTVRGSPNDIIGTVKKSTKETIIPIINIGKYMFFILSPMSATMILDIIVTRNIGVL